MARAKQVYMVTYPNGKIYVGLDLTGTLRYFGSVNNEALAQDFTPEEQRDFTIRKQILWESDAATDAEVRAEEIRQIRLHRANDPAIGYNRWPKFVPDVQ